MASTNPAVNKPTPKGTPEKIILIQVNSPNCQLVLAEYVLEIMERKQTTPHSVNNRRNCS